MNSIWQRKHRWIGHVWRHDELLHEDRMRGKPTRKRRLQMLHYFASDGGNAALKRAAEDRQGWRYRENVLNMWPRCESCKHADLKTSKLKIS